MKFIFPLILFSNLAFSQSNFFLSLISQKLKSYHSFQIEGNYKAYNANGILYNYDFEIVGKKVPTDSTAGFYYIIKSYEKSDSTVSIYCDNVAYIRDKNNYFEITKSENPEYFKDVEHNNGITPAVHKSSSVYKCMPFSFAAYIAALNTHKDLIVTQLKDTIINQKAGLCFEVTVEASKCVNCGKYELILSKKDYSLIKYMKGSNVSGEIVNITNSKLDIEVKTDIFYQEVQKIKSKKSTQNTPVKQNMEGKIAPEWNLPVYGKNITKKLSDFKGKYMLLEFTATNCAACGKALEVMKRLESKFINNNQVAVVSVYSSKADDKNSLKTFVIKNKIKNDLLYADYINDLKTASELESNYKLWGYPTFYLIDKNGMVFKHLTGVSNVSEETEKKIIQLLDEKLKSN